MTNPDTNGARKGQKLVIIGGVAGGASCAARARRLDETAEILLLQSGPDVSFASCGMPYFIGGEITDRNQMSVQTPGSLRSRFNIDVRVNTRVVSINTEAKTVTAINETQASPEKEDFTYDQLVLAVGSEPLKPPIPGINRPGLFVLRNLQDMDNIVAWLQTLPLGGEEKPHAVVAGAGFVGLEMVEQLMRRGLDVTVVEMLPQVLGPLDVEMAAIVEEDMRKKGVNLVTGDAIQEFLPAEDDERSTVVKLKSGKLLPSAVLTILGMGVRPGTKIISEAGIECGPRGHIIVDDYMRTNVPDVWAAGDAIEVRNPVAGNDEKWAVPLAGPANRQGRMIADNIYGMNRKFKGTYAASVVRVFNLVAACVGMNEKMLIQKNLPFACVHVHPGSHAGYFPGAKSVNFKLIFHPTTGKVWGAQAVGEDGVEKRIDVVSTAMQGQLTVGDLAELELCYAPPVGSAKDPVNIAGMAAQNVIDGFVEQVDWKELKAVASLPDVVVLDVRNGSEVEKDGKLIEGAINIPLNDLRSRMNEIPDGKRVVVSCASGQRAYYATRILKQSARFSKVENLSGAWKTYSLVQNRV
ncbi:hypothetical protein ACHAW6_013468 [Cyclotella cf. meneghiniana]